MVARPPRRGEVYWVDFGQPRGSEQGGRRPALIPLPFGLARLMAGGTEVASALSLGLFPKALTTTRDQIELLRHDNLVSPAAVAAGLSFEGLGIAPQGVEAIAPAYLWRFRKTGQYASSGAI